MLSPRTRDFARTRARLIETAGQLFASRGYDRTVQSDAIIRQAGVSKGAFYHHFSSKEELLDAVTDFIVGDALQRIGEAVSDRTLGATVRLNRFLNASKVWRLAHFGLWREVVVVLLRDVNAPMLRRIQALAISRSAPMLAEIIQQGVGGGLRPAEPVGNRTLDPPARDGEPGRAAAPPAGDVGGDLRAPGTAGGTARRHAGADARRAAGIDQSFAGRGCPAVAESRARRRECDREIGDGMTAACLRLALVGGCISRAGGGGTTALGAGTGLDVVYVERYGPLDAKCRRADHAGAVIRTPAAGKPVGRPGEISINAFGFGESPGWDDLDTTGRLKLYRGWGRFKTSRFEGRVGLQKINFGSALLLRPLRWFDSVDPRDPLQITEGVYALLVREYLPRNFTVWVWGSMETNT